VPPQLNVVATLKHMSIIVIVRFRNPISLDICCFYNILLRRLRHRHYMGIFVRSQNIPFATIWIGRRTIFMRPRLRTAVLRRVNVIGGTPGRFYSDVRPSVPTAYSWQPTRRFIVIVRLLRQLFHRRPQTFLPFVITFVYVQCSNYTDISL